MGLGANIPRYGLGGAGVGNLYRAISDDAARKTVHAALAAGAGLIDTAPYYGHGRSETRIGAALAAWSGARPMISSKVGRVLDRVAPGAEGDFGFAEPMNFRPRFDYSREGVHRSLEGSLGRLGVGKLDIALVHDAGRTTHGDAHDAVLRQVLDETLPALYEARAEGRVSKIGLGVNEWAVCEDVLAHADLDVVLLAGRYTLLEQGALAFLDRCAERRVSVLIAGAFNSGLLATRPSAASMYNYQRASPEIVARADAIWRLCEEHGVAPQAAALQFPLLHPAVTTVVIGAQSAGEIEQAAAWRAAAIPGAFWLALQRAGFIAAEAPVRQRSEACV